MIIFNLFNFYSQLLKNDEVVKSGKLSSNFDINDFYTV